MKDGLHSEDLYPLLVHDGTEMGSHDIVPGLRRVEGRRYVESRRHPDTHSQPWLGRPRSELPTKGPTRRWFLRGTLLLRDMETHGSGISRDNRVGRHPFTHEGWSHGTDPSMDTTRDTVCRLCAKTSSLSEESPRTRLLCRWRTIPDFHGVRYVWSDGVIDGDWSKEFHWHGSCVFLG